jgi:hypothetical protein
MTFACGYTELYIGGNVLMLSVRKINKEVAYGFKGWVKLLTIFVRILGYAVHIHKHNWNIKTKKFIEWVWVILCAKLLRSETYIFQLSSKHTALFDVAALKMFTDFLSTFLIHHGLNMCVSFSMFLLSDVTSSEVKVQSISVLNPGVSILATLWNRIR